MPPLPKKAHWPPVYIYLQTACVALAVWFMTYARFQDDAYITLTYARNLLAGNGLVFNPGEYVEGYSNFLFLMLTALLGFLGIDLMLASKLICFASYFALVAFLHGFLRQQYRAHHAGSMHSYAHRINSALALSLVAASAILLAWCAGGMETLLFTLLLTVCVCRILIWIKHGAGRRYVAITGALFALAAMTRIEAIMIFGISGLFMGVRWLLGRGVLMRFAQLVWFGLGFAIIFAPYMLWRLQYFGEWLPNTYYAKVFGMAPELLTVPGLFYLAQFMVMPPMLPLFALGLLCIALRNGRLSASAFYLFLLVVAMCVSIVRAGGDHMYYLRFFVPVVPLLALLIYETCAEMIPRNEKRFRDICGALIVLTVFQFGMVRTDESLSAGAASGTAVADYVETHWPAGSSIALNPLGALPYHAPGYYYIDMMGLVDKHIAHRAFDTPEEIHMAIQLAAGHQKGDGAYVLSRKPDYIIFGNAVWGSAQPMFVSDQEIAASESFKKDYSLVETYITPPAALLPYLQYQAEESLKAWEKSGKNPDFIRNPVLNAENQLRFTYYQRKKDGKQQQ